MQGPVAIILISRNVIIVYNLFCRDGIYFDKILVSEYKLFKRSNKANLCIAKDKKIHEARAFNFTYRYIDDVLSINNSRFAEFLPLIYSPELESIARCKHHMQEKLVYCCTCLENL
jgi:hypothetical protein